MKNIIKIGTRESLLAMVQTNLIINQINSKFPNIKFEIIGIKTTGDMILDKRLDKIGGKGLFIKEIEIALHNQQIDMAVHSLKDLPADISDEFIIAGISKREDPRDALITFDGKSNLTDLKDGAIIGTSSLRREVQLLEMKNTLEIKTLRGNVNTRINKLMNKEYDGIILALAGLKRLGLADKAVQIFSEDEIIPAVGQGALAIETRKGADIDYILESINDEKTAIEVSSERAFLKRLNGGCSIPIACYAVLMENKLKISGMYSPNEKHNIRKATILGNACDAISLGEQLADMLLE